MFFCYIEVKSGKFGFDIGFVTVFYGLKIEFEGLVASFARQLTIHDSIEKISFKNALDSRNLHSTSIVC
jgi:hypothetical protein